MIQTLIYNIGIQLYYFSIYIASSFSPKAQAWIKGRHRLQSKFRKYITSAHGKKIWFHCASLGEFEQARPLIEKIKKLHPDHKLILTFFSPSGFEARRYYEGVDYVGYLPLDTASEARSFIEKMKPSLVIWVKYEFWYHHLRILRRMKVPVVLISAVFRPDHIFFKWYGAVHRRMLGFFTHIFVQNEESKELLQTLGIGSEVCTDTRFDSVYNVMSKHKVLDGMVSFKGDKKIFIAGSTWAKDADLICELINNDPFEGRFQYIIAPHDVGRENIDYILDRIKKRKALWSRITVQNADRFDVAIVDSIGLLSSLYYYGDIAYIGGGFNAGVHNILEPAVFGMPVIFGPHYQRSAEARALIGHQDWHAAYSIKTYDELVSTIKSLLDNDESYLKTGAVRSKEYVLGNTGGTDKIYSYLTGNGLL